MTVKNFIRTPFGLFVTSFILAMIIFCVMRSIRWKQSGRQHLDSLIQEGKVPIIIFWHEHIFAMPHFLPRPSSALQSPHPDGKVLAHAVRYFGLRPIYGSSNRQAISGMRQMMREIRKEDALSLPQMAPEAQQTFYRLALQQWQNYPPRPSFLLHGNATNAGHFPVGIKCAYQSLFPPGGYGMGKACLAVQKCE